ncbi:uncharacterized protein LOC108035864 [Drosophila biarmipes]|uniref:uncharacterized protein LOC108035864 n=1 Tax=Drosophila biarmipes TaxID=125945 RepID=UPI0007E872D0|nr:uncharacterized protein LOC108035864 [Drosophila biarmipes]
MQLEESRRREEGTQKLLKTLTGEVRQLKSVPEPLANNLQVLPYETLPDFKDFDQKFLNDDEIRKELKPKLKMVRGQDVPSFTRLAINAIISNKLAVDITWRGTPDKPSFQIFSTYAIIKLFFIITE